MADKKAYIKTDLIGGGAARLDGIDGAGLLDGDMAFVTVSGIHYLFILDDDSAAAESSPNIITPDTNAGNKRWILQRPKINLGSDADGDMYYRSSSLLTRYPNGKAILDSVVQYGTAGGVIRRSRILIEDGTDAAHIKVTMTSLGNGDVNAVQDNIGKDGVTTGVWSLNAAGTVLTLLATGITGDGLLAIACSPYYNLTGTAMHIYASQSGGTFIFGFYDAANGTPLDITSLVDTSKQVNLAFTYLSTE